MKKSDLKTGMLVQYKDGNVRMVINDYIIGSETYLDIINLEDDLTNYDNSDLTIMKVSNVRKGNKLIPRYWTEYELNENLLWERKEETPIVTIDGVDYSESTLRSLIKKAIGND